MADKKPAVNELPLTELGARFLQFFEEKCRLYNLGSLPKMSDTDVKPALNAEFYDEEAEALRYLWNKWLSTGNISNHINFGKLSDKDPESARLKSKLRKMRLSERIAKKTKEIEKRNTLLEKDIDELNNMLTLKKSKIDKDIIGIKEKISIEIDKIAKNMRAIEEREAQMKSTIIRDTEKHKADEARAKTKMEKNREAMEKTLKLTKEAIDQNIQGMKQQEVEEKKYFDQKIQEMKQQEVEEKKYFDQKIQEMKQQEVEEKKYFDQKIQTMKDTEEKKCKAMKLKQFEHKKNFDSKIKSMQDFFSQKDTEIQTNIEKTLKELTVKLEELKKSIEIPQQFEAEITNEAETEHHIMNTVKAPEKYIFEPPRKRLALNKRDATDYQTTDRTRRLGHPVPAIYSERHVWSRRH